MRVALIQLSASSDKSANVAKALAMTAQALKDQAQLVLLPELFNFRGDFRNHAMLKHQAEKIPGNSVEPFMILARKHKAAILLGSILEYATRGKFYNTSLWIDSKGKIAAKYRKIHLFDARLGDKIIREADYFKTGRETSVASFGSLTFGLSICYDLRFSDLYQSYLQKGANVLTVPSCFTKATGEAHWEVLLRARAIENLSYVLAPNQVGINAQGIKAFGNSMIVSPWGEVIARGSSSKEEIVFGDISFEQIEKARNALPGIIRKRKRSL